PSLPLQDARPQSSAGRDDPRDRQGSARRQRASEGRLRVRPFHLQEAWPACREKKWGQSPFIESRITKRDSDPTFVSPSSPAARLDSALVLHIRIKPIDDLQTEFL